MSFIATDLVEIKGAVIYCHEPYTKCIIFLPFYFIFMLMKDTMSTY